MPDFIYDIVSRQSKYGGDKEIGKLVIEWSQEKDKVEMVLKWDLVSPS